MSALKQIQDKYGVHHVWCNFFMEEHASTCSMCSGLKKNYPQNDKTCEELMKEHFPNNVRIDK